MTVQRLVLIIRSLRAGILISELDQIQMYGSHKLLIWLYKAIRDTASRLIHHHQHFTALKTRSALRIYYFIVAHKMSDATLHAMPPAIIILWFDLAIRQTFFRQSVCKSKFAKHYRRQTFPLYGNLNYSYCYFTTTYY